MLARRHLSQTAFGGGYPFPRPPTQGALTRKIFTDDGDVDEKPRMKKCVERKRQ